MIKFSDLLEAAKKKGVTDKNFGKAPSASKSNFKVGQRVAIDRGMGRTEHGNVHALDIKSGGDQGAMVHFQDGRKEYHPYSKLKDASQYWADADAKMRKERMKENTDFVHMGAKVHIRGNVGKEPLTVSKIHDDQQVHVKDEHGQSKKVMISDLIPHVIKENVWHQERSAYDGPGKGKMLKDMSEKEHIDSANYHGTVMHQLKTGTHKYSKMYSQDQRANQISNHFKLLQLHKDAIDAHNLRDHVEHTDTTVFEAVKLGSKVLIHAPGQSYHGKTGYVGEIRHGAYKGAPKTYTIDYDHDDNNHPKSIQLDKKNIKQVKEEVEITEAVKPLPRRHFFNSYGTEKHGIAHTDENNYWKIENGKPTAHTSDHEVLRGWKRELAAKTKVSEETEIFEGKDGTIIHKVIHQGKVKFITRYGKAAQAVADKIKANTGVDAHITQHIADSHGFYRLHKEEVESISESVSFTYNKEKSHKLDIGKEHHDIHVNGRPYGHMIVTQSAHSFNNDHATIHHTNGTHTKEIPWSSTDYSGKKNTERLTNAINNDSGWHRAKNVSEAYGDKKYSLGKKSPEEIAQKKALQAKHIERTAELKKHIAAAEESGDWEAHEKHEKALRLHQAMYPQ